MKITNLQAFAVEMPLAEPYTIAYETINSTVNIFLSLETDQGLTGFGCAAPDLEVTGETAETVLSAFKDFIEPTLKNAHPFHWMAHLTRLKPFLEKHPSALAMVDMALMDLLAKKAGLPLYQIFGAYRTQMATSITIGILPIYDTLRKGRSFLDQGFKSIKLKGGVSVQEDIEKVFALRQLCGPNYELRFDANQGYSIEEAIHFVRETRECRLELLEQPTPRTQFQLLGEVAQQVHLPIMADESLMNLLDTFHLAKNNWMDMVNIKLMRVGGINEAMAINAVSKAANCEAMVGCMDESALGISAGLAFALARPNIHYADLDGHLDLLNDPAQGAVLLKDGILYPSEKPGLGVHL